MATDIYSCNVTNGKKISDIADVIQLCQLLKFQPVLNRTARSCSGDSNIISTCPSTFNGSTITIKQCTTGSFRLVTAGDGKILRNKYCAECNGFDNFMCYKILRGGCGTYPEKPPGEKYYFICMHVLLNTVFFSNLSVIGASLSKPHTSQTASPAMFIYLLYPSARWSL